MPLKQPRFICVYLLQCTTSKKKSYIGYTTNLKNRLRKHRGEIKGGAKHTRMWGGEVELIGFICGFRTKKEAMSFEWYAQHAQKCSVRCNLKIKNTHARLVPFCKPLLHPKFLHLKNHLKLFLCDYHHALKPICDYFQIDEKQAKAIHDDVKPCYETL